MSFNTGKCMKFFVMVPKFLTVFILTVFLNSFYLVGSLVAKEDQSFVEVGSENQTNLLVKAGDDSCVLESRKTIAISIYFSLIGDSWSAALFYCKNAEDHDLNKVIDAYHRLKNLNIMEKVAIVPFSEITLFKVALRSGGTPEFIQCFKETFDDLSSHSIVGVKKIRFNQKRSLAMELCL